MSTVTTTKASVQQHLDLSKILWAKGISPEQSLTILKESGYKVNGFSYDAAKVAQGIAMVLAISSGIQSGKLSSSKKNGLTISKPKEV
jgi:hypothetical protein